MQLLGGHDNRGLVLILDGDEDHALQRQPIVGRQLRLEECQAKLVVYAHDLSRGPHLRPQENIGPGQLVKGQENLLD